MQLNRKTTFEGKPRIFQTTRSIKQNVHVSRAETVNQPTEYLRDLKKHLPHTLDGPILNGPSSDLSS